MPMLGADIPFADQTVKANGGALVVVNSTAAAQRATLEAPGTWLSQDLKSIGPVLEGTVDIATGALSALRQRYAIYAKGNKLMKVDLDAPSGGPVPTQLSSITTNNICFGSYVFFNVATDFADPTHSYLLLMTPNAAGHCMDLGTDLRPVTSYLAVRMNMAPGDAPLAVPNPLAAIRDAHGAITGFIVRAADRVQKVDANFANPVDLFQAPVGLISEGVFGATAPGIWVYTNTTDTFAVDLANPGTPTPLGLPGGAINHQAIAVDGDSMYLPGPGPSIYRIDANRTATKLATISGALNEIAFTSTRVIYLTATGTIGSVPKSGGTPQVLVSSLPTADLFHTLDRNGAIDPTTGSSSNWQHTFLTGGENIWWVSENGSGTSQYAVHMIASDGSNAQTINGARIVSWTEGPTLPWNGVTSAHTVYVAEGENANLFGASQISAYDTSTRGKRFVLGSFPSALSVQPFDGPAEPLVFGQAGLIRALVATLQGSLGYNLFLFKSDTNGMAQATSF